MTNTDFFSFIPTFITAVAGFITAIVGLIPALSAIQKKRNTKAVTSSEAPRLKFLMVKRTPLEKVNWQRFKTTCLLLAIICIFFVVMTVSITLYSIIEL